MKFPDYWQFKEWEREFDDYVAAGDLPNLLLVRLPHDHFGQFPSAIDKVNTVETQMGYALGFSLRRSRIAPSRTARSSLWSRTTRRTAPTTSMPIAVSHSLRSLRQARRSDQRPLHTVNLLRTMEEVLGLDQLGLIDASAQPMTSVFDLAQAEWDYRAIVPDILRKTRLPIPSSGQRSGAEQQFCGIHRPRSMAYWQAAMQGQYFEEEDRLDTDRFNKALWTV